MRSKIAIGAAVAGVAMTVIGAPAAAAESGSFRGSCDLTGSVNAPRPNDQLVQRGTCTGWLTRGGGAEMPSGNIAQTFRVRVTTKATGLSVGPLPVLLSGPGKTKFVGRRVAIRFDLRQLALMLSLSGAEGGGGSGYVVPHPDGSFDSHVNFSRGIRG
jgi:hypothetical protein